MNAWDQFPTGPVEPVGSAVTDEHGHYSMEVSPGHLRVSFYDCASFPTLAWEWWSDSALYSEADTVEVLAGDQFTNVDAILDAAAQISGDVVDASSGAPVNAICAVLFDGDGVIVVVAASDSNGEIFMPAVRAGTYHLAWVDCAQEPYYAVEWYPGVASVAEAEPLVVEDEYDHVVVHGEVFAAGSISGRVTDAASGEGVPEVCVYAYDGSGIAVSGVLTSVDGSYHLGQLHPGAYQVAFFDCAAQFRYAEQWFGGSSSEAGTVIVNSDQTTADVNAEMKSPTDGSAPPAPEPDSPPSDGHTEVPPDVPHEERSACPEAVMPPSEFGDVPFDHTHASAIDCVAWWGIARGVTTDRYQPMAPVTRAQMASFIARLLGLASPLPSGTRRHFSDVEGNAHEEAINQLFEAGIVRGLTPTTYGPDERVTRAQMASFLVRAFEYVTGDAMPVGDDHFDDDVGDTHEQNINKAADAGFARGRGPTTYAPRDLVVRGQMASFLARVLDALVQQGYVPPHESRSGDT